MKLQQLDEISKEASVSTFMSLVSSLTVEMFDIAHMLQRMVEAGTGDSMGRSFAGRKSRWFTANGPRMQSVASTLKSMSPAFKQIADIKTSAYAASSKLNKHTNNDAARQLIDLIPTALKAIGNSPAGRKLTTAVDKCEQIISDYKLSNAVEQKAYGTPKSDIETPKSDLMGDQYSAVEMATNDIIKALPSDLQHPARQAVSKADNKLQVLKAFLSSHNILA